MDNYTEWADQLRQSSASLIGQLVDYLPNLFAAAALLVLGWLVARLSKALSVRLMLAGDRLWQRFVTGTRLSTSPPLRRPSGNAVGSLVFWLVMLFFLAAAAEALGIKVFANWLAAVVAYLPALIAGMLILLAGVLIGNLARDLVQAAAASAGVAQSEFIGRGVQLTILGTALLIGADQVGIEVRFLVSIFTVLVAAVLGGAALAFGMGARHFVSNLIAARTLRGQLQVGQRIRIQDLQGAVLEITPTTVRLQTEMGEYNVPAYLFEVHTSQLLTERTS